MRQGSRLDPHRSTASNPARASRSLLQLQRQYGNRYVERVLALAREDSAGLAVDRQDGGNAGNNAVAPEVEDAIHQKRGGGQSLDHGVREQMESSFGADFSGVRVHTDRESDSLNHALSARAFTTGKDIFFREGAYQPGSSGGRELLAHELTHVVQQGGDQVRRAMAVSQPGDPHEVEAEQTARAVMEHEHSGLLGEKHKKEDEDKEHELHKPHTAMTSRSADLLQKQHAAPKAGGHSQHSLSAGGLKFIERHEGYRDKVYNDSAGKPTIGYGHLIKHGEDFSHGVTQDKASELLAHDTSTAVNSVNSHVTVELSQNKFDAVVDFTYNLGGGALGQSTLLKNINGGHEVTKDNFTSWNHAGGKVVAGLTTRRNDEFNLFSKGDYGS